MSIKELAYKSFKVYFVLVTCITAVIMILGMIFDPDARFGYDAFMAPFKYALLGIVPTLVMYSKNELSVKQLIIRKIVQLAIIEIEIMSVAVSSSGIDTDEPKVVISVMLSVIFVFAASNIISYINDSLSAKRLTKELMNYQDTNTNLKKNSSNLWD